MEHGGLAQHVRGIPPRAFNVYTHVSDRQTNRRNKTQTCPSNIARLISTRSLPSTPPLPPAGGRVQSCLRNRNRRRSDTTLSSSRSDSAADVERNHLSKQPSLSDANTETSAGLDTIRLCPPAAVAGGNEPVSAPASRLFADCRSPTSSKQLFVRPRA